jgi:methyl-accepting chemotaxis protein
MYAQRLSQLELMTESAISLVDHHYRLAQKGASV